MRTFPILAALLMTATVAALPSSAADCTIGSSPAIDVPSGNGARPFYLATNGGIAVYEETNGIDDLQRRDRAVDDTCGGAIPSDTIRAFASIA